MAHANGFLCVVFCLRICKLGNVEFDLAPQLETSCDSEIQTKKDFKNQVHKATWKLADNLMK